MSILGNIGIGVLGKAYSSLFNYLFGYAQWGIYTTPGGYTNSITGAAVSAGSTVAVAVDSVLSLDVEKESTVSDFVIESGSFNTYNKIERPREIPIRVTKGGTEADRAVVMKWAEDNVISTLLFNVMTPEKTYTNMTLSRYNMRRDATEGATLLTLDLFFIEVREVSVSMFDSTTGTSDTSNAKNPGDLPTAGTILTQAKSVANDVAAKVSDAIGWA
jgi:hypothetical protein